MRALSRGQWWFDAAVAAGFVAIGQFELRFLPESGHQDGPLLLNTLLALLCAAPLAIRRRCPFAALAMAAVPQVAASLLTVHALTFWGMGVPMAILCYSVSRWSRHRHAALLALAAAALVLAVYGIHVPDFVDPEEYLFGGLLLGAAVLVGAVIAQLNTQRQALNAAMLQLRRQEEDRRRQVLADERSRIAREMHDVMAHGVTVMVVQAGSARLELSPDAAKARESLLIVEQTGRNVLTELRHTVGLLRNNESALGEDPTPTLAALPALVGSMKAAGLDVSLDVDEHLDLDPGRALAVYRVIQEALTNTLRHGGHGAVKVRVSLPDDLLIEVLDTSAEPVVGRVAGGGNGLLGMRERVGSFGGELTAGPEPGGFAVRARIPLERQP